MHNFSANKLQAPENNFRKRREALYFKKLIWSKMKIMLMKDLKF